VIPAEKIIVALDTQDPKKLYSLFQELKDSGVWVKIGMEIFYSLGNSVVHEAKKQGFKVFLDLKLHDIPTTVSRSMKALSELPIDMVNVHAAGGADMMKAAAEALLSGKNHPLLIAVTQLTSATEEQIHKEQNITGSLLDSVTNYAKLAKESGCHGVVSSPFETPAIKLACGSKFITVTPGIRPRGTDLQDQKRVARPLDALRMGTDFMVIGRPITQEPEPRMALENILKGL
jgi:orotidine-5'-phosphate decarboxylase